MPSEIVIFKKLLRDRNNLLNSAKDLSLISGLTNEQVTWIKGKVATVELWKNTAVTEIVSIKSRLTILETKAAAAQAKFVDIEKRLKALEL